MTDQINLVADYVLLAGLPGILWFTINYGVRAHAVWRKSLIGWMFFSLGATLSLFILIVLSSLFISRDYPSREFIRLAGYVLVTLTVYFIAIVYEIERRSPTTLLPVRPPGEISKQFLTWVKGLFRRRQAGD